jgi:hypothetical protein
MFAENAGPRMYLHMERILPTRCPSLDGADGQRKHAFAGPGDTMAERAMASRSKRP